MDETARRLYRDLCDCADRWTWTAQARDDAHRAVAGQPSAEALVLRLQASAAAARAKVYREAADLLATLDA